MVTTYRILLIVAVIASLIQFGQAQSSPPIKIGAILPLSGSASNFGAIARRGIELALEDLSQEDRARVSVVYEDDGLSNSRSATAVRKLLTIDKVDALLTWSSGTGITVASIAEAKKIPHLSIASDPAVAQGRKFSFTYWPIASDEAEALVAFLKTSGLKKIAVLSQVHNGIFAIRDALINKLSDDKSILIIANEEVSGDVGDFRAILERVKAKGEFDALMPIFFPGQLAVCIKQARALGITAQLIGFETFEDKDEIKAAAGAMTGAVYATGGDPQRDFIKKYEDKYPGESYYTGNQAYDVIRLYVDASRQSKDSEAIISYLKAIKDRQTSSGTINITESNQFRLPTTLKRIGADGMPQELR